MVWWQILIVAILVGAIAVAIAYSTGLERGERLGRETRPRTQTELSEDDVLFGVEPSVRVAEESFVHAMPEAVILVNGQGNVVYMGKRCEGIGLTESGRISDEDAIGILARVAADGKPREREIELPVDPVHTGAPVVSDNSGHGVQAGERVPSNTRYLKLRVAAIGEDRYAIFVSDMSEQRRFEAMRRDFMTNVSHELKTPAGAISLLAETIGDAADDPDAVRYFSGRVAKESTRLTELVHRLIDLQKAQDSAGVLDAKRLSVLAVVRHAIAENQVQADASHIELDLSFNGDPVSLEPSQGEPDATISCDEESITTSVKNLIENAIHYSPEHTTVRIAISAHDGKVKIRVIDQGIGIPAESIDRIFERFYRVDPARSRQTGGTGLGLAIVKHCVADCGGTVSVWSREGEGSTFTIELPLAEDSGGSGDSGDAASGAGGDDTAAGNPAADAPAAGSPAATAPSDDDARSGSN
ncbi:two-component sensor histidine kinase [Bifidobacterium rousetti]|uniref:sensor histidine kinase n=1 Tax=Bifidobacterium rousetti TaxID=2045439 RepID=UPI000D14367E|nr:ATP-binding protein [Bifidobacterium rousetti]KAA8815626.1 two-component sensor histidine kinase [Bifidobacterium rousetti]PST48772.1 two-component sensor histidine kinase [Bifidobacterium callitrichos]